MTRHGTFCPGAATSLRQVGVLAYVLDQPTQREALQEEILERIAATQALSQTMATAQLESPDPRSHVGLLDALAILSRDVRGLMEARFHPGP